jgi:hypothetical protein
MLATIAPPRDYFNGLVGDQPRPEIRPDDAPGRDRRDDGAAERGALVVHQGGHDRPERDGGQARPLGLGLGQPERKHQGRHQDDAPADPEHRAEHPDRRPEQHQPRR